MPTLKDIALTKNFSLSEFACHDLNHTPVPKEYMTNVQLLAKNLQILRDYLGEPIHINSGYRTPAYNATLEGSAVHSQHTKALAADITTINKTPAQLHAIIEKLIAEGKMKQGGLGRYNGFTHYDCRGRRARWDYTSKQ